MEIIQLTTPEAIPTPPPITGWSIAVIHLDIQASTILITFRTPAGDKRDWLIEGTPAYNRIRALMVANLSLKSLPRRIYELALTDGVFAGSITGAPD